MCIRDSGKTELKTYNTYFVLEKEFKRLDKTEFKILGKTADIVMCLYGTAFKNVGIYCTCLLYTSVREDAWWLCTLKRFNTFMLVCFAWIFFRVNNFADLGVLLNKL